MSEGTGLRQIGTILPNRKDGNSLAVSRQSSAVMRLADDQEGKKILGGLLAECFEVFPTYGRTPQSAASVGAMFLRTLEDFEIGKIVEAFKFHSKNNTQFPVPADIANIIRRGNRPPFSNAVYIAIQKKPPEDRDRDDWAYLRGYEEYMKSGEY